MVGESERLRILLYLLVAAVALASIGTFVHSEFRASGLTIFNVTVSGLLSVALVILYFRQTRILNSQRELLTSELNREARQQHTETLRERVQQWHGNPDREVAPNPLDQESLNLPSVGGASFESAPAGLSFAISPEEEEFHVVPYRLSEDRYFQDLLENHAPDLRKSKEEIENLHSHFTDLRSEFRESYSDGITREKEEFLLKPTDYLSRWIFELTVMYARGTIEGHDELYERAISEIERGETSLYIEESRIWIQVEKGGSRYLSIYSADIEGANREELQNHRSAAKQEVEDIVSEIISQINTGQYPYELAQDAGEVLDEAQEEIGKLEQILIEYEGRPIYTGDCKYLEEAKVGSDTS